jgi:hypothetical protein
MRKSLTPLLCTTTGFLYKGSRSHRNARDDVWGVSIIIIHRLKAMGTTAAIDGNRCLNSAFPFESVNETGI